MRKLLIGAALGVVAALLFGWGFGILPKSGSGGQGAPEPAHSSLKTDISWFIRLEGYPELVYKDADLVATLTQPEKVSVFRVRANGELKVAEYGLDSGKTAAPRDAEFYSAIVSSPTSMTGMSACRFEPGFAIRFERKGRSRYAFICYSCSDIIFLDEAGESVAGWGMTHEAASALLHRFQEAFPDDSEVLGIKF